jgi:uncharacterized protein (DUF4213/DUF364 family)
LVEAGGFLGRLLGSLRADMEGWRTRDVRIGAFWTAIVLEAPTGVYAGLASTLGGGQHLHGSEPDVRRAGELLEASAVELAELVRSESPFEAAVGLAAINALLGSRAVPEGVTEREVNAAEVIAGHAGGRRVAIVGHFPFVPRLRQIAGQVDVLELAPREGDLPAERSDDVIPAADVVAMTGTTLLNHTYDSLIALCRPDAYVLVLGGTTPLSAQFFQDGVDAVAGTRVGDIAGTVKAVSQGANFRQIPGKQLVTWFR